jgi:hypothetical protein
VSDDQLAIGGQLGPYLIDSVIGRGGMSVVYRARHSRLGMWVALKVLAPELGSDDAFRERFLREAQMAAAVDHPNVIPIHDMGVHEGSLYIVMRYVSGGDLKALLAGGSIDSQLTLRVLAPAAQALDAAHARGLVHRDVKPANVLIQRAPSGEIEHVYLKDFGTAKSATALSGLTGTGVFIGTIEYMAPEQMESREVSAQTDVYALGATVYQCLTGRLPFHRELAEGARPPLGAPDPVSTTRSDLPPALDAVLAKALARHPADRYASCSALMDACEQALAAGRAHAGAAAGPFESTELAHESAPPAAASAAQADADATPSSAGAGAPPPPARPSHPRRRPPAVVLVGGLLVLAAAVVGVVLALGSSSSKTGGPAAQAALAPVPSNRVTGSGQVSVHLVGDKATVSLTTNGLDGDAELVHAMHIHAGGKGECPPASAAKLHNGHLAIDTNDGIAFYGPPVESLTTRGNTGVASILVFQRYPVGGTIRYSRTIELPAKVAAEIRDNNAVIVVHGIDYDGSGVYSGVLDRSDLNKALPATATAPALCGPLKGPPQLADSGRAVTYVAALRPTRVTVGELSICGAPLPENGADTRRRVLATGHARQRTAA